MGKWVHIPVIGEIGVLRNFSLYTTKIVFFGHTLRKLSQKFLSDLVFRVFKQEPAFRFTYNAYVVRFENKNISSKMRKRWRCSCKF
jgi:hypothetical protein